MGRRAALLGRAPPRTPPGGEWIKQKRILFDFIATWGDFPRAVDLEKLGLRWKHPDMLDSAGVLRGSSDTLYSSGVSLGRLLAHADRVGGFDGAALRAPARSRQ